MKCAADKLSSDMMSIENLAEILESWSTSGVEKCRLFYRIFTRIYDVKFKQKPLKVGRKTLLIV